MAQSKTTPLIVSPLQTSMLLEKAVKERRETRVWWLNNRDTLSLQENAWYCDYFIAIRREINTFREALKGREEYIQAQLN